MENNDNKTKEVLSPLVDIFFQEDGKLTKQGALIVAIASVSIAMAILKELVRK